MNNGKLQAKQEKLKSLHCPSTQSFLFNSRDSSVNTNLRSLAFHSPAPNSEQSVKSLALDPQHRKESAAPSLQNIKEPATGCMQQSSEYVKRFPQQLFIDMSTELLRQGKNVRFRAPGLSMHPAIKEGETITVAPISPFDIKRADILLYIVGKKFVAHRVVSIKRKENDFTSHSSDNFAIQSKSDSSANSSTRATTLSNSLTPQIIFTLRGDASAIYDDPVEEQQVLGKVISVERHGRNIDLYNRKARMFCLAYTWASRLKRLILCLLRKWGQAPKAFKAKVRI